MANRFWARTGVVALLVAGMTVSTGGAAAAPQGVEKGATRFFNMLEKLTEGGSWLLEGLLRGLGVESLDKAGIDIDPFGVTLDLDPPQGGSEFDADNAGSDIDPFG